MSKVFEKLLVVKNDEKDFKKNGVRSRKMITDSDSKRQPPSSVVTQCPPKTLLHPDFKKCEHRRNTVTGCLFPTEMTTNISGGLKSKRKRGREGSELWIRLQSLSPQIVPKFGLNRIRNDSTGSLNSKIDWTLKRMGPFGQGTLSKMSEGRLIQVLLLGDQKLEIVVQPKLFAYELHEMAASHLRLKEKGYFGLTFRDDTGHYQWLQLDRRVLEHDLPRQIGPLVLHYQVKFFVESITFLRDSETVKLFYLQAIQLLYKGQIECDSDTVFELAAYVLQVTHGDYTDNETTKLQIKKLMILSTSVLKQHPSLAYCEDQVILYYKKLKSQTFGSAVVNYMSIVESLASYGVHYYDVKDKTGIPWWLGIGFRGVSLYDHADRKIPRKVFLWKQLENLYFREKKFSIEVVDLTKNTTGSATINVHSWIASTTQLAKSIWTMTVGQHQFYLNRRHLQSVSVSGPMRSLSEIADEINRSVVITTSTGNKMTGSQTTDDVDDVISSSDSSSLTSELKAKEMEALRIMHLEMFEMLKCRKNELQMQLISKMDKLKELCLKEAELTGVIPPELPLMPGESLPQVRKRVGTTFVLSPLFFKNNSLNEEDEQMKFEMEFEIQEKITAAELQLAQDKTLPKSVRKKHRRIYRQEYRKLKELEGKMNLRRQEAGQERVMTYAKSLDDLSEDSREFLDEDTEFEMSTSSPTSQIPASELEQKLVPNYYRRYTHRQLSFPLRYPSCTMPRTCEGDENPSTPRFQSPDGSILSWSSSVTGGGGRGEEFSTIRFYPKKVARTTPSPRSSPSRSDTPSSCGAGQTMKTTRSFCDGSLSSPITSFDSQLHPSFSMMKMKRKQSTSSISSDFSNNSCSSSSMSSLQQSSICEKSEDNLYNAKTFVKGRYESGDELLNSCALQSDLDGSCVSGSESNDSCSITKHGSLDRRMMFASVSGASHQPPLDGNNRSGGGSLDLPELSASKFGSKRESTIEHCVTNTPSPSPLMNYDRLNYGGGGGGGTVVGGASKLKKNCSERSHQRRRETPVVMSKGQSNSNLHLRSAVGPSWVDEGRPATPLLYMTSPTYSESFDSFEGLSISQKQTMHTPLRMVSGEEHHPLNVSGHSRRENEMDDDGVDIIDSPDKLAKFRKDRYGKLPANANATAFDLSRNHGAVDALFKHHEETTTTQLYSFPTISPFSSNSHSPSF